MTTMKHLPWIAGSAFLFLCLLAIIFNPLFQSDDTFDTLSYMARATFLKNGNWTENWNMGYASFVFEPFVAFHVLHAFSRALPGIAVPYYFARALVFILLPLVFLFVASARNIPREKALFLGLIFVLNPFTVKFLFQRFPEALGWLFFLIATGFFYRLVENNYFSRKHFAGTLVFSLLTLLTHSAPFLFLMLAFTFWGIAAGKKIRAACAVIATGLLGSFWLLPFFAYLPHVVISSNLWPEGWELQTPAIFMAKIILTLSLILASFLLYRIRSANPREFAFSVCVSLLAAVYFLFPWFPILSKPFPYSFFLFYLFALLLVLPALCAAYQPWKKKAIIALALLFVAFFTLFPGPVLRAYAFERYPSLDERFGSGALDKVLSQIPGEERFAVLPVQMDIVSYAAIAHDKQSLFGHGEFYAETSAAQIQRELMDASPTKISCEQLRNYALQGGTKYWVAWQSDTEDALAEKSSGKKRADFRDLLSNCGLKKMSEQKTALFKDAAQTGFSNFAVFEYSAAEIFPGGTVKKISQQQYLISYPESGVKTVRIAYFPRWAAFQEGKELALANAAPGLAFFAPASGNVELRFVPRLPDYAGLLVSVLTAFFLCALLFKKNSFPKFRWLS